MSTTTAALYAPETKIGDIVTKQPALARVFESLGIDYCCGGKQTLVAACTRRQLDPHTVGVMLEAAAAAVVSPGREIDTSCMTLTELADHIERTHHAYTKTELPRLQVMSEQVASKHAWRDARLAEVQKTLTALAEEMFDHMRKEEVILFPMVRLIDASPANECLPSNAIANPIQQMEIEHESAGNALARLRELTDGFVPGAECCNTHRALLAGLAEFESDLHRHVHKENNILFPRALARAGRN